MANDESSTKELSSASAEKYPLPLYEPYSYLVPAAKHNSAGHFAEQVMRISRGAGVIAEILRSDVTERDAGNNPVLDVNSIEALAALLAESMRTLSDSALDRIDFINAEATQGE